MGGNFAAAVPSSQVGEGRGEGAHQERGLGNGTPPYPPAGTFSRQGRRIQARAGYFQAEGFIRKGITAPETFGVTSTPSAWMIGWTYWRSGMT